MYSILLPDFSLLLLNVKCKGLWWRCVIRHISRSSLVKNTFRKLILSLLSGESINVLLWVHKSNLVTGDRDWVDWLITLGFILLPMMGAEPAFKMMSLFNEQWDEKCWTYMPVRYLRLQSSILGSDHL
jgi:hypothetical protein